MPVVEWKAGKRVTAADLTKMQTQVIRPTASQTLNNTTTLTDDPALFFALEADAQYVVEIYAVFSHANAAADVRFDWTAPAGATGRNFALCATSNAATFTGVTDARALLLANSFSSVVGSQGGTGVDQYVMSLGPVSTAGTAGDVQFRWGQNTATAANTTRLTSSYMRVMRFA